MHFVAHRARTHPGDRGTLIGIPGSDVPENSFAGFNSKIFALQLVGGQPKVLAGVTLRLAHTAQRLGAES